MVAFASRPALPPQHDARRAAEDKLALIRRQLHEVQRLKKAREKEFAQACHSERLAVREHIRDMRKRALADLRAHSASARGTAKLIRLTRLGEMRQIHGATVAGLRAAAEVERKHRDELARIDRDERARMAEIHQAHERSLVAGSVRAVLLGKIGPLFDSAFGVVPKVPGESRAETILRHAGQNADKAHALIDTQLARKVEEAKRAVADAERNVRAVGGNVHVPMARVPQEPKPARSAPVHRGSGGKTDANTSKLRPSPAASAPAGKPKPAKKGTRKAAKRVTVKKTAKKAAAAKAQPTPPPVAVKGPRGKGELRRNGAMPLEDPHREREEMKTSKAAHAERGSSKTSVPTGNPPALGPVPLPASKATRGMRRSGRSPAAKPSSRAPSPSPIPPALVEGRSPAATAANTSAKRGGVTSTYVSRLKPYRVRASCGHVVTRMMAESTAGVPYSADVVLDRPHGAACDKCEAKKDYGANAPRRAEENEVKAPELRDAADIAKRIRQDIAEAVRTKALPPAKFSVRTSKYSMGSSITVEASALPFPVLNAAAFHLEGHYVFFNRDKRLSRYAPQAETVRAKLEAIVKAYHWDKSDLMTDHHHSRFHYDVRLDEGDEFERIEETLKRAGATSPPSTPAAAPSVVVPKPPARLAPLQLVPQISDAPTVRRGARPRGVQQSLILDAPLLHVASKPLATVIPFPARTPGGDSNARKAELEASRDASRNTEPRGAAPAQASISTRGGQSKVAPAPQPVEREPRYRAGDVVESKWGERARIEGGGVPTEWGTLDYRVVRGLERGQKIHDLWPAEVIARTVAASPEPVRTVPTSPEPAAPSPPNPYEQKQMARVDRLRARSEKLQAEAEGAFKRERSIGSVIPLGQPILVGHHSEKRHRRDLERMRSLASKGVALSKQAEELARRADAAEESAAISSDDPEAMTKLRDKIAQLEAEHARMVAGEGSDATKERPRRATRHLRQGARRRTQRLHPAKGRRPRPGEGPDRARPRRVGSAASVPSRASSHRTGQPRPASHVSPRPCEGAPERIGRCREGQPAAGLLGPVGADEALDQRIHPRVAHRGVPPLRGGEPRGARRGARARQRSPGARARGATSKGRARASCETATAARETARLHPRGTRRRSILTRRGKVTPPNVPRSEPTAAGCRCGRAYRARRSAHPVPGKVHR